MALCPHSSPSLGGAGVPSRGVAGLFLIQPGMVFAGDFRIVRPLAEGGMGAVYVAEQLSTGQLRALKVMQPKLLPDEKSRERFLKEARIGSRVESEHVVQVLAAGVDHETQIPWLAMELLEGTDLDHLVRERGPLSPQEALDLIEQVGHALIDAHEKGIIHRDLKPENLFLARARRRGAESMVKVLDFGIAQITDLHRSAATVTSAIGSPLWMAPEQAQPGAKLRPATDVWAIGLITFFLLTGRSYWLSANAEAFSLPALLAEVLSLPLVPASERARALGAPALPPALDAWFARALDRNAEARFPDARGALQALRDALQPRHVAATAPLPSSSTPSLASTQPLSTGDSSASVLDPASSRASEGTQPLPPPALPRVAAQTPARASWEEKAEAPLALPSSRSPVLLVVAAVAALVVGGAVFALATSDGAEGEATGAVARAPGEESEARAQIPAEDGPGADPYDAALAACRRAVAASEHARAISHADTALRWRPGDEAAAACRAEAVSLQSQAETFQRGVGHLAAGEMEEAYFAFETLPPESAYRSRPQVAQATQACANAKLAAAQDALRSDPSEARRLAQFVLNMDGITSSQRTLARTIEAQTLSRVAGGDEGRSGGARGGESARGASSSARATPPARAEPPSQGATSPAPASLDSDVRTCALRGDNACVIRLLEGRARTEWQLGQLIEAYRARGDTQNALRHMRTFVSRFPTTPRARTYQQILAAHGGM